MIFESHNLADQKQPEAEVLEQAGLEPSASDMAATVRRRLLDYQLIRYYSKRSDHFRASRE